MAASRAATPLVAAVAALFVAAPAPAATALMPGVTYEFGVEFTPLGPVALHVVSAPRPTGLYALKPVLSNETVVGTERVTSMQRRLAPLGTMVGINGDFWEWATGRPSGVLMQDNVVVSPPAAARSSVGVRPDGTLDIRRVALAATWRGNGGTRVLHQVNKPPGPNQLSLFTGAWGPTTPEVPGSLAAVLAPAPPIVAGAELAAPVVEIRQEPSVAIPPGGAVLVARDNAAGALLAEAPPGTQVAIRPAFRPDWPNVTHAVGGGPVIVRNGGAVFRANEAFTTSQLEPRHPRTAIGQRADGSLLFVVADGRRPGYSIGLTNFGLAQTLVRLGAVTASALDAGGSSTLAFDGRLLNRPSDPAGERPVSTALMLTYTGVFVPRPIATVSPNGDGVDEDPRLRLKVVRPSTVTTSLVLPDGSTALETTQRGPGVYPLALPAPTTEGVWKLTVSATDDLGQASTMARTFTVNSTLGFLTTSTVRLLVPPRGRNFAVSWRQARAAQVTVTLESPAGTVIRTLARRSFESGTHRLNWRGLLANGKRAPSGPYVVRVVARNELGTTRLVRSFVVRRTR